MYKVGIYLRVRKACFVEGMSVREAARVFGLHRDTVRTMLEYSVPPGYRRQRPARRPKLDPYKIPSQKGLFEMSPGVRRWSGAEEATGCRLLASPPYLLRSGQA